jgi:hypothetical protein
MECPKCNASTEMRVQVTLIFPSEFESQLTKKLISSRQVKIYAVDWDAASYLCKSCGWGESGVIRYTKILERRVAELELLLDKNKINYEQININL